MVLPIAEAVLCVGRAPPANENLMGRRGADGPRFQIPLEKTHPGVAFE